MDLMTKAIIDNLKQDGEPRKRPTVLGRLLRGVGRGIVDGSPILGPIVTAFAGAGKGAIVEPTARIFTSSATTVVVVYLFLDRLAGDISIEDFLGMISVVLHGQ